MSAQFSWQLCVVRTMMRSELWGRSLIQIDNDSPDIISTSQPASHKSLCVCECVYRVCVCIRESERKNVCGRESFSMISFFFVFCVWSVEVTLTGLLTYVCLCAVCMDMYCMCVCVCTGDLTSCFSMFFSSVHQVLAQSKLGVGQNINMMIYCCFTMCVIVSKFMLTLYCSKQILYQTVCLMSLTISWLLTVALITQKGGKSHQVVLVHKVPAIQWKFRPNMIQWIWALCFFVFSDQISWGGHTYLTNTPMKCVCDRTLKDRFRQGQRLFNESLNGTSSRRPAD